MSLDSREWTVTDEGEAELERLLYAWAARETGVLSAYLESAGTPSEAAAEADVTEASARVAGRVLASLGVLERVEGEYEPTNRALGLMVKRDPRSVGSLPHRLDVIDTLVALPETMETGVPPTFPESWHHNRVGASEAVSEATRRACVTTAIRAAPGAERVLDVCGGAGGRAAEFEARGVDATVVESPTVLEATRPLVESRGVAAVEGPLSEIQRTFDLVVSVDDVLAMDVSETAQTVTAAAERLAERGALVVIDRFDEPAATAAAVRGVAAGTGDGPTASTVADLLAEAGLTEIREESVPGTDRRAVIGERTTGE